MSAVLDFNSSNQRKSHHNIQSYPNQSSHRKSNRSKKRKSKSSRSSKLQPNKRRTGNKSSSSRKKNKSKRKGAKRKKLNKKNNKLGPLGPKQPNNNDKNNKDLPIITEEDYESGFSDSYIPTRYDASGYFSYHTWGKENVRPPDEDRIVRTGPSIWHWTWDLSFGLYDDIYDNMSMKKSKNQNNNNADDHNMFLENTWLNLEGPIPSWQPLFAAIIWFIISMNILFPVSIIAQSSPCPIDYCNQDGFPPSKCTSIKYLDMDDNLGSNWKPVQRRIHIDTSYAHLSVGLIFFSYSISSWITSPISSFLILKFGASYMLFIGILLMIVSSILIGSTTFYLDNLWYIFYLILFRIISGIGFNIVRESSLFLWSIFAKLDMLSSGLGFCVGPVLGDLLYTYIGYNWAFYVYSILLSIILLILLAIISFKLLTLSQISLIKIPSNIKNIRKPRYDLLNSYSTNKMFRNRYIKYAYYIYILFKLEILCIVIIGLTALEPTLPIYALNPALDITVSGALFTFIYLPLLALSSLIGLIYAKSSAKFLNSPKKHVEKQRRGMKYITKTLSINFSGMNQNNSNHNNNHDSSKRFNVSKSEKIKLVERPSWLEKKRRLLPSPDISQHNLSLIIGLFITSIGYLILSGYYKSFSSGSIGVDLIVGLVLISVGSSIIIISITDSFINGLVLNINQTELVYIIINVSILCGPLLGGIMLDIKKNELPPLSKYYGYLLFIHLFLYLIYIVAKYLFKLIKILLNQKYYKMYKKKETKSLHKSLLLQNDTGINILTAPNSLIRDLSKGKISPQMHSININDINNNNNDINGMQTLNMNVNKKEKEDVNINILSSPSLSHSSDDIDEKYNINIKGLSDDYLNYIKLEDKNKKIINKNKNKNESITNQIYIYGKNLRHLCWWKRGVNVRFPYIQWMESGWSKSQIKNNIMPKKSKKNRKKKLKNKNKKNKFNNNENDDEY